jgi:20S proteasome alpha/beta subunit
MTLIVAFKYANGTILASDSRVMIGPIKRDQARKLEPIAENIGAAAAGLIGAIDDILMVVKNFCNTHPFSFDDVVACLSDACLDWYLKNKEKLEEEENTYVFILVSSDRIRRILPKGYSEEAYDYACEGSGRSYGEYILRNFYKEGLEENEAKELAVYTIMETSKMDPTVGEDISMLVFPKHGKCTIISKEEIERLRERLAPLSRRLSEHQIKLVEAIVNLREKINDLWKKSFDFPLFRNSERAIFQIMKSCRNEEEFTQNIAALALLIDQINVQEIKKWSVKKKAPSYF